MGNKTLAALLVIGAMGVCGLTAFADEEQEERAVAKSVPAAKITLQQGLTAAESQGKPISGKFEVDEGHFQLSVYTAQGGKFSEVVIDHNTGAVAKSEPITEGEDLAEAKAQAEAITKAKRPLKSAVDEAEKGVPGARAVSVTPKLSNGHTVAVVKLLKGTQFKSVSEPLE